MFFEAHNQNKPTVLHETNRWFPIIVTKTKRWLFFRDKKRTNGFFWPNHWFCYHRYKVVHRLILIIHSVIFVVHKLLQLIHRENCQQQGNFLHQKAAKRVSFAINPTKRNAQSASSFLGNVTVTSNPNKY